MKKEKQMVVVLVSMILLGCSASLIINKGNNNEIDTHIRTNPDTDVKLDSISILNKDNNKQKDNN